MSAIEGKIEPFSLRWKSAPRGPQGSARVAVATEGGATLEYEVSWRRDAQGIWIELPHGVFGFDISGSADDDGRSSYELTRRGAPGAWSGLCFARAGEAAVMAGAGAGARKGVRVRAQMPGKIIGISVKPGDHVEKDQALIVMEAMKMENVIRAPQAGKVQQVQASVGQAVETGAELCVIDHD